MFTILQTTISPIRSEAYACDAVDKLAILTAKLNKQQSDSIHCDICQEDLEYHLHFTKPQNAVLVWRTYDDIQLQAKVLPLFFFLLYCHTTKDALVARLVSRVGNRLAEIKPVMFIVKSDILSPRYRGSDFRNWFMPLNTDGLALFIHEVTRKLLDFSQYIRLITQLLW